MPPAKKTAAKKLPAKKTVPVVQEVTGPSSEPTPPVLTLGAVSAPVVRTGTQLVAGSFIVEGLTAFGVPLTDAQGKWLGVALTLAVTFVQNLAEKHAGRRLIGAPT